MGKTLLTPRHSLNASSDPRHIWTWELVEASKSWLPILVLVVYTNWDLTYTTRQSSRVSCVAQTGFAAFGKGVQLISGSPYSETEQLSLLITLLIPWLCLCGLSPNATDPILRRCASLRWKPYLTIIVSPSKRFRYGEYYCRPPKVGYTILHWEYEMCHSCRFILQGHLRCVSAVHVDRGKFGQILSKKSSNALT